MTKMASAHLRAFFIVASLSGSVITGCQEEAIVDDSTGETMAATVDGVSDTDADPAGPSEGASDSIEPSARGALPSTTEGSADPAPSAPTTFPPTSPITVRKNEVVKLQSGSSEYFVVVPDSYDASHGTASSLFVWLHGCGGYGANDARVVSPSGSQTWVTVSVGGRDGACWKMDTDSKLVIAALDDVKKRLNIDPHRVVIGGYSSGGNLAYRTAFYNADRFAGVLAENTAAFYGTGSSEEASLASASWKLNIVHLAQVDDTTFKIATVRRETETLKKAGFPVTLLDRPGGHWDSDTNTHLRTLLLPYLNAGWRSPG